MRCLVVQPIDPAGTALLRRAGVAVDTAPDTRIETLTPYLLHADAVITRNWGFPAEAMALAPRLRVIGSHGTGVDRIDVAGARARGISVVNTPGANAADVAELALGLALALAVPLGIAAARFPRLTGPVLAFLGVLYTVPSLAALAFLIPSLGIGRLPAVLVLAAYAQLFLVRNIVAGLRGVDAATIEAAAGMGMTPWQVFAKVRWPLALPVMIAGLRTAAVTTISLATVAAWIDAGGLGTLLFEGITRDDPNRILAGTVAISGLALATDALLRLAQRPTAADRARRAAAR